MNTRPTRAEAEAAVTTLLRYVGEDPRRDGLQDTPRRVVDALQELTGAPEYDLTTFDSDGYDQLILQQGIPLYSLCEHHMLPIVGHADVGYLPDDGNVVGLSKLARCVEHHARQLQNQERITEDVAADLMESLDARGVGVTVRASHYCMEMRGVKKHDTYTTTSALLGALRDGDARDEFLTLTSANDP